MWHRNFSACVSCQTTNYRFMAKGLCSSCYAKEYKKDPAKKARIDQQKKEWYRTHFDNLRPVFKRNRESAHFDGMRDAILERDGYKCTKCESPDKLTVHHKDRNGRGNDTPNNDMDNLTTLCRGCHIREHRPELQLSHLSKLYRRQKRTAGRKRMWEDWNDSTLILIISPTGDITGKMVNCDSPPPIDLLSSLGVLDWLKHRKS